MGYFIARRVRRQAGSNCRHFLASSALCRRIKKPRNDFSLRGLYKSGGTYFRTCSTIIGSKRLTTVFGMVTGVTTLICSPEELIAAYSPAMTLIRLGLLKEDPDNGLI